MKFRPCIDLHNGKVVQIVGGSLSTENSLPAPGISEQGDSTLEVNFTSERSSADYAEQYRRHGLDGGHVIALGQGNKEAALKALSAYSGGLQYGGGVNPDNAPEFLQAGASHVIVTSYVFSDGKIDFDKLDNMVQSIGRDKLVLDLSCRWREGNYYVVTNRWQNFTTEIVDAVLLEKLEKYCAEFLVHGVDVEGKRQGIQEDLITLLGQQSPLPVTYAGGVKQLSDLDLVKTLGQAKVDLTIGSALDIFGGDVPFTQVLEWSDKN